MPKSGRSGPTPANDHKSLTGMDTASEIVENPRPLKKESRKNPALSVFRCRRVSRQFETCPPETRPQQERESWLVSLPEIESDLWW